MARLKILEILYLRHTGNRSERAPMFTGFRCTGEIYMYMHAMYMYMYGLIASYKNRSRGGKDPAQPALNGANLS